MRKYLAGLACLFVVGNVVAIDLVDPGLQEEGKTGLKSLCGIIASNNVLLEVDSIAATNQANVYDAVRYTAATNQANVYDAARYITATNAADILDAARYTVASNAYRNASTLDAGTLAVARLSGHTGTVTNNFVLYITNGLVINAVLP